MQSFGTQSGNSRKLFRRVRPVVSTATSALPAYCAGKQQLPCRFAPTDPAKNSQLSLQSRELPHYSCLLPPQAVPEEPLGCFPLGAPGPQPASILPHNLVDALPHKLTPSCLADARYIATENCLGLAASDLEAARACLSLVTGESSMRCLPINLERRIRRRKLQRPSSLLNHPRAHSEELRTTFYGRYPTKEPVHLVQLEPQTRALCFRGDCYRRREALDDSRGGQRTRTDVTLQQECLEEQVATEQLVDQAQQRLFQLYKGPLHVKTARYSLASGGHPSSTSLDHS